MTYFTTLLNDPDPVSAFRISLQTSHNINKLSINDHEICS